jgi:hypothetical protein
MAQGDGQYLYYIEVDGTRIRETYGYDEHKSPEEVRRDWLQDVEDSWGARMAEGFKGNIEVTDICSTTTTSSEESQKQKDEPIPLPPVKEEEQSRNTTS